MISYVQKDNLLDLISLKVIPRPGVLTPLIDVYILCETFRLWHQGS